MFENSVYFIEIHDLTQKWVKSGLKGFTVDSMLKIVRRRTVQEETRDIDGIFGLGQPGRGELSSANYWFARAQLVKSGSAAGAESGSRGPGVDRMTGVSYVS